MSAVSMPSSVPIADGGLPGLFVTVSDLQHEVDASLKKNSLGVAGSELKKKKEVGNMLIPAF